MMHHIYRERDYAFGQVIVTLRTAMGLTQVELAQFHGVSRGAVLGWEAGSSYPKAERLKRFIALGVRQQAFAAGRKEEEIRALWHAAHQKVLLDESWLSALLSQRLPPLSAVDTLRRRSLIERGKLPGSVTLHAVVLEYVTRLLIEEATSELTQGKLSRFIEHSLVQAGAREDVRQTQERLIVAPILSRLRKAYPGRVEVEEHLLSLLQQLRDRPYERLTITGVQGLTEAQKATLRALGALEEIAPSL